MWRAIATGLMVVGGLILVLVAMAQARDRRGSTRVDVLRAGGISLAVLAVCVALVATVLTPTFAWGLVAATIIADGVILIAD
ncbi:hypothetical protein [Actinoalloteichus hymeniacidonis]|uniref:Uncharacterized protein n=1 Tax=Actinoalloteichus hymeniacidonis TaxID=340345 RepID=A0AAC9HKM1_9PSEU|nr:hypothetical protein [Actinoalloteichus hymeniacidonis]AOS61087.1 hypothetical protein TL08_01230 [Actinoalloteichus hymeniacidonis]